MKNIEEVMSKYTAQEISTEEANAELDKLGATFHLSPLTDEERAEKKRREDEAGKFDTGREFEKPLPQTTDKRRRPELANEVVIQQTATGPFAVFYDENGYAVRSRRVTVED